MKNFPSKIFSVIAGVVATGGKPLLSNISANFRKNSERPELDAQGPGGNWFMKKT
jgi:hypothetical protein